MATDKLDPEVEDKLDQVLEDVNAEALASEPVLDENQKSEEAIADGEQNQR